MQIRDDFDDFENNFIEITDCIKYVKDLKREKRRKVCTILIIFKCIQNTSKVVINVLEIKN